jgi:hypothetical protein
MSCHDTSDAVYDMPVDISVALLVSLSTVLPLVRHNHFCHPNIHLLHFFRSCCIKPSLRHFSFSSFVPECRHSCSRLFLDFTNHWLGIFSSFITWSGRLEFLFFAFAVHGSLLLSQCDISSRHTFPYLMRKIIFTRNQYLQNCALLSDLFWRRSLDRQTDSISSLYFREIDISQSDVTKAFYIFLCQQNYEENIAFFLFFVLCCKGNKWK